MKKKDRKKSLISFIQKAALFFLVIYVLDYTINKDKKDETVDQAPIQQVVANDDTTEETTEEVNEDTIMLKMRKETFEITKAKVEDDGLLYLVFDFTNLSDEPNTAYSAWTWNVDVEQEDDIEIYKLDSEYFNTPDTYAGAEQISIDNNKIKPNGTKTYFHAYNVELEDEDFYLRGDFEGEEIKIDFDIFEEAEE